MAKFRVLQILVSVAVLLFVCGQQARTQQLPHNYRAQIVHRPNPDRPFPSNPPPTKNLYGLDPAFAAYAIDPAGSNEWPCFGGSTNPDCSGIQEGGVVLGIPQYVWSFADCDANTPQSTTPCGQTEVWYEDDTGDTTDDLIYTLKVTQMQGGLLAYISDSGTVDLGPNPHGGMTPPADVIIAGDQNFGTLGQTGKNNGNCDANFNYPTKENPAGVEFVIAANKICSDPIPGPAMFISTVEIATPTYKLNSTLGTYTVTYTVRYKLEQKWNIFFQ
jgi:hypothetical protein